MKVGDKVKEGDTITYNQNFFTPDPLDSTQVLWKAGVMSKVAIVEASDTFEDSSAISESLAKKLSANVTKVRHLFFEFDDNISRLVKVGDSVDPETILCIIEDAVTAKNELFTEETLDTLRLISGNSPRAKYSGTIDKIEVIYYGDKEDMSDSLQAIVNQTDNALIKERKALGKTPVTGEVTESIRIDNRVLEYNTLVMKVYITHTEGMSVGDKGVFGNQLKTVVGRVMSGVNKTESGDDVDALFAYSSISNRIVYSPELIGTTNTLLRKLSQHVAKVYRGS